MAELAAKEDKGDEKGVMEVAVVIVMVDAWNH
jgi:hypothetical protein